MPAGNVTVVRKDILFESSAGSEKSSKAIKKVVVCFALWISSHCVKDEIHAFGHDFSVVQYIKKYLANSA